MISRLLCLLFGHRWSDWTERPGHEFRVCERCVLFELRRGGTYRYTLFEDEGGPGAPGGLDRPECSKLPKGPMP